MYKLIAIDLDGTLLNSYGEASIPNKIAIKKAIEDGKEIVLTSGRISESIEKIANELSANNYLIAGNGAIVYDMKNNDIIYSNYIEKEKALKIIKICEENSIYYSIYTRNMIITKSLNYNALFYNSENKKNSFDKQIRINITEDIYNYVKDYKEKDFLKITICDEDKNIFLREVEAMRKVKKIHILDVSHMSRKIIKSGTEEVEIAYFYTEITNENVNKWNAIEFLINLLNIKQEEVIAIGDNINDKEMIQNAAIGIAMGNSCPEIKNIADKIVADNNSDGVAEAIHNIMKYDK